jgi:hypothetical protein
MDTVTCFGDVGAEIKLPAREPTYPHNF